MIPHLALLFPLLLLNPLISSTRASEAAAATASASASSAAASAGSGEGIEAADYMSSAAAAHAFGDMKGLPDNVLRNIATFLSPEAITRLGRTCQRGKRKLPKLHQAHLLSRLSALRDTRVLPPDISRRYLRRLKERRPETLKRALSSVFYPGRTTLFSAPSTAAFLFSNVPEIDSLDSDILRDRLRAALTSAAEPGHAMGEWQDSALTHFLSERCLYKTSAVTDAEVARVVASLVPEFHACEYISLAAYLGGSAGTPVATKAEVRAHMDALNARLADNPDQRLVIVLPLDVDVDSTPVVSMNADDIPVNLRNLLVVSHAHEPHGVRTGFLAGCRGLREVTVSLPQATAVGDAFLRHCINLTEPDLYLPRVTTIGAFFFG